MTGILFTICEYRAHCNVGVRDGPPNKPKAGKGEWDTCKTTVPPKRCSSGTLVPLLVISVFVPTLMDRRRKKAAAKALPSTTDC
jgi:hypothetical protein